MKWTALAATFALLAIGVGAAVAGSVADDDADTVIDSADNCSTYYNPAQDDTDGDDCGNVCDGDFDQTGKASFSDFGAFSVSFGGFDLEKDMSEPVVGPVGFADFGQFTVLFGVDTGPSGTTAGTIACP